MGGWWLQEELGHPDTVWTMDLGCVGRAILKANSELGMENGEWGMQLHLQHTKSSLVLTSNALEMLFSSGHFMFQLI